MLTKIATVMMTVGIVAAASGTAEAALGTCKVKVKVNNKCGHKVTLHYVNFWHKDIKNKYSIPTIGFVSLDGGKSKSWSYDVLMACKTKKKVEVKYAFSGSVKSLINKTSSLIDEALNPALRAAFADEDPVEGLNPFLIGGVVGLDTTTYDKSKDKYSGDNTEFFPELKSDWQSGSNIEINLTRCKF